MKKRKILPLVIALVGFGLVGGVTSCGNDLTPIEEKYGISISGPTSCEVGASVTLIITLTNDSAREGYVCSSDNEAIATIDDTGKVVGISAGTVNLKIAFASDSSIFKNYSFTVTQSTQPSISIETSSKNATIGGAITLTAKVVNPNNATLKYQWKIESGSGSLTNAKTDTATIKNPMEGDSKIKLTVTIGQMELSDYVSVYFKDDYTSFTKIGTKEEFTSNILKSGDNNGKYCLTADIDMGGAKIDGNTLKQNFGGVLDGCGHTISNFEVISGVKGGNGLAENSGMIFSITGNGIVRNLHLSGKTTENGAGWGTGLLCNVLAGTVKNCSFDSDHQFNQAAKADSAGWFPFNGTICGILKETAKVTNNVVNVTGEGAGCEFVIAPYVAGGSGGQASGYTPSQQTFTINGIYTNSSAISAVPWDWGGEIQDLSGVFSEITWSTTVSSEYENLNETLWNLVDNQIPELKEVVLA